MDQDIIELINRFSRAIKEILGNSIVDVILHGSTVDGGFIKGKGDIDFLVLVDKEITDQEYSLIKDYHRNIRKTNSLDKQLEGCYLTLNEEKNLITKGVYIGTGERGWKKFEGDIFSQMDKAHVLQTHYSLYDSHIIETIFTFKWANVEKELVEQLVGNFRNLNDYEDFDFKLHVLHTSARSLFSLEHKTFISKLRALEWLEKHPKFDRYKAYIQSVKHYKSTLSMQEEDELRRIGFEELHGILAIMNEGLTSYFEVKEAHH